jgi:hypothetical protein
MLYWSFSVCSHMATIKHLMWVEWHEFSKEIIVDSLFRTVENTTWRCRWTKIHAWNRPRSNKLLHCFSVTLWLHIQLLSTSSRDYIRVIFFVVFQRLFPPQPFILRWYFGPNLSHNMCLMILLTCFPYLRKDVHIRSTTEIEFSSHSAVHHGVVCPRGSWRRPEQMGLKSGLRRCRQQYEAIRHIQKALI